LPSIICTLFVLYDIIYLDFKKIIMTTYLNLDGDSGVEAYEISERSIKVKFLDDGCYLYDYNSAGVEAIEEMKHLAISGSGLNAYINTHVKNKYASKC
jgi:hypothetical protein